MKRPAFNLLATASLVLCMASLAISLRSQFVSDTFYKQTWTTIGRRFYTRSVTWNNGRIGGELFWIDDADSSLQKPAAGIWTHESRPANAATQAGSYWYYFYHCPRTHQRNGWAQQWMLAVRIWPFTAAFALMPLSEVVLNFRNRRRRMKTLCAECGYDLRATPNRCPECGAVPAQ